ncbi:hypothetical protein LTR85_004864 [Meristemomyces frigidus]|nr:hypothetical protein LTR85_004864 [Meristemomyces frigidus]
MMTTWNPLRTPLLPLSTCKAPELSAHELYEEERNPGVPLKHYYPMRLGEVLHGRYQVAAKLGHGAQSTVWLARDLNGWSWQSPHFVALKVAISNYSRNSETAMQKELETLKHIKLANPEHQGYQLVRTLLESFTLPGPSGDHLCIVLQPLRESIARLRHSFEDGKFPVELLAILAEPLLQGLDYLHRECHVVHTDLKADNIMMSFPEGSEQETLLQHETYERTEPLPQKISPDRTIYLPHNYFGPQDITQGVGRPVITDFDLAIRCNERETFEHDIQPQGMQAPEVVLGLPWDHSAEIWNLAVVFCDLLEGCSPFVKDKAEPYKDRAYMARMISYLGEPPASMTRQRRRNTDLFEVDGNFAYPEEVGQEQTLDTFFADIEEEERELLVPFLMRMLKWMPQERATAQGLLEDPFLNSNRRVPP